jgi:hypothetical protein
VALANDLLRPRRRAVSAPRGFGAARGLGAGSEAEDHLLMESEKGHQLMILR